VNDPNDLTRQGDYLEQALARAVNHNRSTDAGIYSLLTTGEAGPDPADADTNPKTPDGHDLAVDWTQGMGGAPKAPDPLEHAFRELGIL